MLKDTEIEERKEEGQVWASGDDSPLALEGQVSGLVNGQVQCCITVIFPVSKETLRNLIPVIVLNYLPILSLSPTSAFMETCGLAAQAAKSLYRSLDARFTLWFHNKITQSMEGK